MAKGSPVAREWRDRLQQAGCIIGMDEGLYGGGQPAHARLVQLPHVMQTEEVEQALVEEGRLALGRQTPDVDRDHVHELRELPLPFAQRLLRAHLIVDVERNAVPLHNRAGFITPRLHPALRPSIGAILLAPTKPHRGAVASFEAILQRALHFGSIFGMNQLFQQRFDARLARELRSP